MASKVYEDDLQVPALLPTDIALVRARQRIHELSLELRSHDDVDVLMRSVQRRINESKQRVQKTVAELQFRVETIEEVWAEQLDAEEKRLMTKYGNRKRELEEKREGLGDVSEISAYLHQLTDDVGMIARPGEPVEVTQEKLKRLKERIDEVSVQINEQALMAAARTQHQTIPEGPLYGVCEITESYKQTTSSLQHAVLALDRITRMPAISTVKGIPSREEVIRIRDELRKFLIELRMQMANVCIIGSPACSPTTMMRRRPTSSLTTTPMTNSSHKALTPAFSTEPYEPTPNTSDVSNVSDTLDTAVGPAPGYGLNDTTTNQSTLSSAFDSTNELLKSRSSKGSKDKYAKRSAAGSDPAADKKKKDANSTGKKVEERKAAAGSAEPEFLAAAPKSSNVSSVLENYKSAKPDSSQLYI